MRSDWPLPEGLWSISVQIEAAKESPLKANLTAEGEQGAFVTGQLENGSVNIVANRLALSAGWGELDGLSFAGHASWPNAATMPTDTRFQGRADSLKAGDMTLANFAFSGRQEGTILVLETGAELPGLQGHAKGTWSLPLGSPDDLALNSGEATLLDGQLSATGLRAEAFFREPPLWFRWSAARASVAGEPLTTLQGECGTGPNEGFVVRGAGRGLGGKISFSVRPEAGEKALSVETEALEAAAVASFLRRFQELPFGLAGGKVAAQIDAPLRAFGPGWHARVTPSAVTLLVPDDRHEFRGLDGNLVVEALAEGVRIRSEGLTLEGGRVPVALEGEVGAGGGALRFRIPTLPAKDVQNALFDFLPEFVGYGEVSGGLGLEGEYQPEGRAPGFRVKAHFAGGAFASEDKSLVLDGLDGTLALAVGTGGGGPLLPGFRAPDRGAVAPVVASLSHLLEAGESLTARGITFSVYGLSGVRLSSAAGPDGITRLRLVEGTLWDGPVRADVGLSIGSADIRYAGQLVMDHASLREFCRESEGLTGFLGGRFSGSVTFRGDRMGLGSLKALADLAVDPAGDEPLVLGRDFLVKVGGAPMKKLVTRRFQEYDQASLKVGIRAGGLTVQDLVLSHEASPFKALMRKDLSFELRVPLNNSISLYNLLDLVKGIGARTASVETP